MLKHGKLGCVSRAVQHYQTYVLYLQLFVYFDTLPRTFVHHMKCCRSGAGENSWFPPTPRLTSGLSCSQRACWANRG